MSNSKNTPISARLENKAFESSMATQVTKGPDRVILKEWAGGIPEEMATLPEIRVGQKWYSFGQIVFFGLVAGIILLVGGIFAARSLRALPEIQAFIAAHPGTSSFGPAVTSGFPWWLRYQYYFNFVLMLFIIRAGLQILADHPRLTLDAGCKPDTEWLRLRGAVP